MDPPPDALEKSAAADQYLAVFLTLGLLLLAATLLALFLRPLLPARVNCWFCNADFRVAFSQRNSWTCPGCSQYNGFDDDGDYNIKVPGQLDESQEPWSVGNKLLRFALGGNKANKDDNGLCGSCNLNQQLKVFQLSKFEPSDPQRFDQEVDEYAAHLERAYKLCRYCEANLHQVIGGQDSWIKPKLLSWKLEKSRKRSPLEQQAEGGGKRRTLMLPVSLIVNLLWRSLLVFSAGLAWICCCCCGFISSEGDLEFVDEFLEAVNSSAWFPACRISHDWFHGSGASVPFIVVSGTTSVIACLYYCKAWALRKSRLHQFCALSWTVMAAFQVVLLQGCDDDPSGMIKGGLRASLNFSTSTTCLLASILAALCSLSGTKTKGPLPHKRRRFHCNNPSNGWTLSEKDDNTLVPGNRLTSTPGGESVRGDLSNASSSPSPSCKEPSERFDATIRRRGPIPVRSSSNNRQNSADISALSLHEQHPAESSAAATLVSGMDRSPLTFSIRKYDPVNNSGINFGDGRMSQYPKRHQPLIRPSRFTQASWVAGGYWQDSSSPASIPPGSPTAAAGLLSRSSSQSSGFVSHVGQATNSQDSLQLRNKLAGWPGIKSGGNGNPQQGLFASSVPSSTCGNDLNADRFSVLSEPVRRRPVLGNISLRDIGNHVGSAERKIDDSRQGFGTDDDSWRNLSPPRAQSSPVVPSLPDPAEDWMARHITIRISLYSAFLAVSIAINLGVSLYFAHHYLTASPT